MVKESWFSARQQEFESLRKYHVANDFRACTYFFELIWIFRSSQAKLFAKFIIELVLISTNKSLRPGIYISFGNIEVTWHT